MHQLESSSIFQPGNAEFGTRPGPALWPPIPSATNPVGNGPTEPARRLGCRGSDVFDGTTSAGEPELLLHLGMGTSPVMVSTRSGHCGANMG